MLSNDIFMSTVFVADINMPKINGLEFTAACKSIKPDVKICIVTGYDYFDYAQTALKLGVDDYILKPASKKDISEALGKLILKISDENYKEEIKSIVIVGKDGRLMSNEKKINMSMSSDMMKQQWYVDGFDLSLLKREESTKNIKLGGVGIKNVDKRIKLYYGEEYGVNIDSIIGEGTTVYIRVCGGY
jgi:two-component system response regulator YesN